MKHKIQWQSFHYYQSNVIISWFDDKDRDCNFAGSTYLKLGKDILTETGCTSSNYKKLEFQLYQRCHFILVGIVIALCYQFRCSRKCPKNFFWPLLHSFIIHGPLQFIVFLLFYIQLLTITQIEYYYCTSQLLLHLLLRKENLMIHNVWSLLKYSILLLDCEL